MVIPIVPAVPMTLRQPTRCLLGDLTPTAKGDGFLYNLRVLHAECRIGYKVEVLGSLGSKWLKHLRRPGTFSLEIAVQ